MSSFGLITFILRDEGSKYLYHALYIGMVTKNDTFYFLITCKRLVSYECFGYHQMQYLFKFYVCCFRPHRSSARGATAHLLHDVHFGRQIAQPGAGGALLPSGTCRRRSARHSHHPLELLHLLGVVLIYSGLQMFP